jgi:acetoacetyl-CoA synthetase
MSTQPMPAMLWEPTEDRRRRAVLTRYMAWLGDSRGLHFAGYHELWRWSVRDLEGFWSSIWEFFDVRSGTSYERVLADRAMPGAQWFPGATINYAEHLFRDKPADRVAILHASEVRELSEMTWGELSSLTASIAAGLRAQGVQRGDRVVAYMPNTAETVAAFLATASLGAVWLSCSPDFGARAVVDRVAQIEPKVLLAVDGYRYNGRDFDRMDMVAGLQGEMPSLQRTVVLPYLSRDPDLGRLREAVPWEELVRDEADLAFESVPFDHPLWSCTPRAPPVCQRRSCKARGASCSSTSSNSTCISTHTRAIGRSGSPPPAG